MGEVIVLADRRVSLTRVELARIMRAGAEHGAQPGATSKACPYSPSGNATERVKCAVWVRGRVSGRDRQL